MAEPKGSRNRGSDAPRSTFRLGLGLAVVSVAAKAVDIGPPELTGAGLARHAHDLAVAAHADVVFAAAVAGAAQLILRIAGRSRIAGLVAWSGIVIFCVASVFYAVLSVQLFTYLRTPLSYPLLYLAGDMKNMQSSVGAFATPRLVAALTIVPLLYFLAVRTPPLPSSRGRRPIGRALGAIALSAYLCAAWRTSLGAEWINRDDRLLAESPHWVLLSSSARELFTETSVRLKEADSYPAEILDDFRVMTGWSGEESKPRLGVAPRNVIVLVLESTAARYLSLYGGRYATTPRLAAESRHSLVFDNFYCHFGLTSHSLVALTLSIYPGMTWREYTVERPDLPGTTAAEVLRHRGYRTAFLHSGDLQYSNQEGFLSDRGFDHLGDFRSLACGEQSFSWGVEDRCLIDGMLAWIDRDDGDRRRPFYLMGWTIQTHHPYPLSEGQQAIDFLRGEDPPDGYDLARYLNVLHEVDRQIGRLLDGLRSRGLADDTLVVITGDHGEAFGDPHDTYGHGRKLYQENVHVPLVLWNPKLFPVGGRSQTIGAHVDLNPTLLDLLGLPTPESWQGRSLFDPARPPRAYFYAADHDYLLGVREHDWKYVYDVGRGREYLFDLARDPNELVNRAAEEPARCRRLRQRVAAWMDYEERYLAAIEVAKR